MTEAQTAEPFNNLFRKQESYRIFESFKTRSYIISVKKNSPEEHKMKTKIEKKLPEKIGKIQEW